VSARPAAVFPPRKIKYLSAPAAVSMTDGYFELASLDHFWVRRRFEVFQRMAGELVANAKELLDVGCGQGMLQRQMEQAYDREVAGFDLNENGLKHNLSESGSVYCYDLFQRDAQFEHRFDLVFLWDVLEHISDEDSFLGALLFHLSKGGHVVINVPAGEWAFSGYDTAAGHVRRYSDCNLFPVLGRNGLQVLKWTYWGLPLSPVLLVRKIMLSSSGNQQQNYCSGFGVRSGLVNRVMGIVSKLEVIPQKIAGTSLMAVLEVGDQ